MKRFSISTLDAAPTCEDEDLLLVSHLWACLLMLLPIAPPHMVGETLLCIDDCDELRARLEERRAAA